MRLAVVAVVVAGQASQEGVAGPGPLAPPVVWLIHLDQQGWDQKLDLVSLSLMGALAARWQGLTVL